MEENVLVIIKPDAISKKLTGNIISLFSTLDLKLIAVKMVKVDKKLAQEHYRHIENQPFFNEVVDYLVGEFHEQNNVLVLIYRGENAIRKSRELAGATSPLDANPKSIRGLYGQITPEGLYENVIHVSSEAIEAEREIKLWFTPEQITADLYPTKEIIRLNFRRKAWS